MKIKAPKIGECGKRCYTEKGALNSLFTAYFDNNNQDITPNRSYYCNRCHARHLTSQPLDIEKYEQRHRPH